MPSSIQNKITYWPATLLMVIAFLVTNLSVMRTIPVTRTVEDRPTLINSTLLNTPSLKSFISQVKNGDRKALVGVYVPFKFAFPITQQPANDAVFVSTDPNLVTQFGMASRFNTVGLLAHNNLAGAAFYELQPGQNVYLVYGDGSLRSYVVKTIRHYQALDPTNTYSDFVDQDITGRQLTSAQLFKEMYGQPNQLVFQTCIQKDGEASWGRIFIDAAPTQYYTIPNFQRFWEGMVTA